MNMLQICLLLVSALFGGALNSVAGGGSFFTFPTLLWAGIAPVNANIKVPSPSGLAQWRVLEPIAKI